MEGPIKQLYEKDGAEFKPIRACDCTNQGGDGDNGDGGNGGGGGLPDSVSAVASAYSSDTPEAEANVNPKTGLFTFKFGLPRGERGPQGPPGTGGGGIEGDTPVAHKSVMVFRTYVPTDNNPKPAKPVGGSWDVGNDIITYPEDWGPTDNVEKPVWMSTGEFSSADPADPKWSDPIMISGEDGTNGTDGVDTEFIYKLTETSLIIPNKPKSVNQTDYVPKDEGWTDSPSGISEEMQCEWVCTRKKDDNGDWSSWDGPVIWAKWGVNGTDGDGVEYIYKVNNGEALDNPTPEDTTTDEYQSRGEFEGIEYVPTELGWTDEPTGVSIENTHEWVCVRKQKNGVWQRFSNPALWAKYGEQGDNGISIRTMYAITGGSDEVPDFDPYNIIPGSIWSLSIPFYESPEAVWSITAYVTYDNKLATVETVDKEGNPITVYGWQGPVLVSGTAGKDGTPVNYKTYVYKLSDSKPDKPTSNDPKNPGDNWVDYPNTTGQWWQCIGSVNGVTELVTEWGEVLPVNGQDGIAQDGKRVEFRFAVNDSQTDAPAINKSIRQPSGWTTQPPIKEENQFMWMTVATINPDDTLAINWSDPVCISGERGPQGFDGPAGPPGPMGPNGISGIPGKDIEARYCLGTADRYDATYNDTVANTNDPIDYGWQKTIPSVTKERLYIWCIQTSFIHTRIDNDNESYVRNLEYPWPKPFRLSGINGLPGERGKSQIIYPAGIYDNTVSYTADDNKAPYVFDTSDNNFYVLNYKGTWLGKSDDPNDVDQDDRRPSQDYAENKGKYWMLLQSFDAIYANIGVFGNALVGSAVFNGDYMFSQLGINKDNNISSSYQYFCDKNSSDPYDLDNTFRPNWCVNLRTGEQWASAGGIYLGNNSKDSFIQLISGNSTTTVSAGSIGLTTTENGQTAGFTVTDEFIKFDAVVPDEEVGGTKIVISLDIRDDGSGSLANGKISWDKEGNLVIRGSGTSIVLSDSNSYESWQTKIDSNGVNIIKTRPRIYSNGNGGQLVANLGVDGFNVVSKTLSPTGVELAETEILSLKADGSGSMASRSLIWDSEGNLNIKGNNSGGGNIEFVDDTPSDPQEGVLYIFI